MTTEPTDDPGEETEGTYNPSGGIPSHPADPQTGGDDDDFDDDDVDVSDDPA